MSWKRRRVTTCVVTRCLHLRGGRSETEIHSLLVLINHLIHLLKLLKLLLVSLPLRHHLLGRMLHLHV